MMARLRWSAFGLRGRIVGAVVATTAVTLGVAALVLLPQLEGKLKGAALAGLKAEVRTAQNDKQVLAVLRSIPYKLIPLQDSTDQPLQKQARQAQTDLANEVISLRGRFGASNVTLIGFINAQGEGVTMPTDASTSGSGSAGVSGAGALDDVRYVFSHPGKPRFSYGSGGTEVRAAISLGNDSVLAVRAPIGDIPLAVQAVRTAFEIAAAVAILMTIIIAIPLAGTIVARLRRLRQAALHVAIDGSGRADFPVDRARDEVGDLARSFSIMQRRLRQQEEARRAFVATASHELRTPLASLEGMLELLADDLQAENIDLYEANSLLDRARAQSHRLGRLAADLLDLSRIDAEVALRSEPVELTELSRAVVAEFEVSSMERGVVPVIRERTTPAWALADPGSVARILRILMDNALRVAPAGSEVVVSVSGSPVPTLSVIDQGPGVTPEERGLIFDRFKRGTETGGEAGFGLGLAIGRELAQRMGGTLVLTDGEAPGAMFTLTLRPAQAPSPDQISSAAGV
jgi:signal transduction histidine kinase